MIKRSYYFIVASSFVFFLFTIFLKLFTARFYYLTDPTTGILLKHKPSFLSKAIVNPQNHTILIQDENSFIGEAFYVFLTTEGIFWSFGLFSLVISFLLYKKLKLKIKVKNAN